MDTILILTIFISLLCIWRFPQRPIGQCLFWVAWVGVLLLFKYHVTDTLPLSF